MGCFEGIYKERYIRDKNLFDEFARFYRDGSFNSCDRERQRERLYFCLVSCLSENSKGMNPYDIDFTVRVFARNIRRELLFEYMSKK